jgi:5'-nucleotidase / UDP-sugar diphosphatase
MAATRRFVAGILLIAIFCASSACAETARITFILVNDIYLIADQMMPDGERRGGFARLAAVVKAERAKGGNVIFAHAGDTLSPSLMSGLDRGARCCQQLDAPLVSSAVMIHIKALGTVRTNADGRIVMK